MSLLQVAVFWIPPEVRGHNQTLTDFHDFWAPAFLFRTGSLSHVHMFLFVCLFLTFYRGDLLCQNILSLMVHECFHKVFMQRLYVWSLHSPLSLSACLNKSAVREQQSPVWEQRAFQETFQEKLSGGFSVVHRVKRVAVGQQRVQISGPRTAPERSSFSSTRRSVSGPRTAPERSFSSTRMSVSGPRTVPERSSFWWDRRRSVHTIPYYQRYQRDTLLTASEH